MDSEGPGSEVAQLLRQIKAEYDAATSGLSGLAVGAKHAFITARMENMGKYHDDLADILGPDKAIALIAQAMDTSSEEGKTYEDQY